MMPLVTFLNKIKWDKRENPSDYSIGYLDRVGNKIVKIPLSGIKRDDAFSFTITDKEGNVHDIPFHRVKKVWKKDELVWERKQ